jgi:iron complex outermembrane receptor protein
MSAFSPSIGVSVPLLGSMNVFGSLSTVFETPTTTELANQPDSEGGFNPDLDPMTGRSFELGIRGDLGSYVSGELTAFQTNLENELIPFEVAGSPGVTYSRNAGTSVHKGIELTLSAADPSGLVRGDVTYTYTDATFDDYVGETTDFSGNQVPGVAPGRLQALLKVTPAMGFAELVFTAMDDVPANDANAIAAPNSAFAPSYTLLDLRVGIDGVAVGGATLSPWFAVTNLLDEDYIGSVAVNAFGGRFFEPGPGRSFQFGLRATLTGD